MKTLIICVNYNSHNELINYLESVKNSIKMCNEVHSVDVLIADNSALKIELSNVYDYNIKHVFIGKNTGYFGAITYILKKEEIKLEGYDYVAISNVDLLMDKNFFVNLYNQKFEESIGCIAPKIYSITEKRNRNPKVINRYSAKKMRLLRLMYKYPVLYCTYAVVFHKLRRKGVHKSDEKFIYAPHGSFMLFTKKFIPFLYSMKYPTFLFGEEIFIAENLRARSLKVEYCPVLLINDIDHVSTARLTNKKYFKFNYESMDMLIKEWFDE